MSAFPHYSTITDTTDDRQLLTRRRLLLAGGGTLAAIGGTTFYVIRELDGDTGGYVAPEAFPTITTRDVFDGEGDPQETIPTTTTDGDWDGLENADHLFVFVHGFDTDDEAARNQAYTAQLGLEEAGLEPAVVGYSWDSDYDWDVAKTIADENGFLLASWLEDWADQQASQSVHLFGYSLGARLCCETLQLLAGGDRSDLLTSCSFLGGAVPHDSVERDGRYGEAITAAPLVANFHSRNDRVLSWVYRATDRTRAVGHNGIRDPAAVPDGYTDVDVTDLVADHYSYFQPETGCLPRVVETLQS